MIFDVMMWFLASLRDAPAAVQCCAGTSRPSSNQNTKMRKNGNVNARSGPRYLPNSLCAILSPFYVLNVVCAARGQCRSPGECAGGVPTLFLYVMAACVYLFYIPDDMFLIVWFKNTTLKKQHKNDVLERKNPFTCHFVWGPPAAHGTKT